MCAFVEADAHFQQHVAYQQPGIARRTLARGDDGEWLVETLWWTRAHAESAVHSSAELDAFVDLATVTMRRYDEDRLTDERLTPAVAGASMPPPRPDRIR